MYVLCMYVCVYTHTHIHTSYENIFYISDLHWIMDQS